jgi:hypothetical protein
VPPVVLLPHGHETSAGWPPIGGRASLRWRLSLLALAVAGLVVAALWTP